MQTFPQKFCVRFASGTFRSAPSWWVKVVCNRIFSLNPTKHKNIQEVSSNTWIVKVDFLEQLPAFPSAVTLWAELLDRNGRVISWSALHPVDPTRKAHEQVGLEIYERGKRHVFVFLNLFFFRRLS